VSFANWTPQAAFYLALLLEMLFVAWPVALFKVLARCPQQEGKQGSHGRDAVIAVLVGWGFATIGIFVLSLSDAGPLDLSMAAGTSYICGSAVLGGYALFKAYRAALDRERRRLPLAAVRAALGLILIQLFMFSPKYGTAPPSDLWENVTVALIVARWPFLVGLWLSAYYLVTLPMRRRERNELFLDLIERCLKNGRSVEAALAALAERGEKAFGRRLRRLGVHLEGGCGLVEALRLTPGLLPPQTVETLAVGEETGDLLGVIPACRVSAGDASSRVRGAMNYVIVLAGGVFLPVLFIMPMLFIYVVPPFEAMLKDMDFPGEMPFLMQMVCLSVNSGWASMLIWALPLGMIAAAYAYVRGPMGFRWAPWRMLADRLHWLFSWQRLRLRRDFSAMLAAELDAGVPEPKAVELAARACDNAVVARRAGRVTRALAAGEPLAEALRRIDRSGELRWRMENALKRGGGFLEALEGWHEALDARAFRHEQTAAHVVTTVLVLINGALIGALAIGFFQCMVMLIEATAPW